MLCQKIIETLEARYPGSCAMDWDNVGLLVGRRKKEVHRIYVAVDATDEVIEAAIDYVDCPYECEVNLMLTDNETIHAINKEQREIDRPTDVLSFPMAEYEEPADFSKIEEDPMAFDPESGEFLLGDIVISMDKVWEQAENYGHSREREYAFLIAHSMLHLFGYDHMEEEERKDMEKRQEEILTKTKYTRDERGLV